MLQSLEKQVDNDFFGRAVSNIADKRFNVYEQTIKFKRRPYHENQ